MTFRANNINSPNGMITFMQAIEGDMQGVGWVLVSANVNGNWTANATNTTTNTAIIVDVLKSPGTNNSISNDWYIALGRDTASNSQLFVTMFAGWNAASNQAWNYYLPNTTAATQTPFANGFHSNANAAQLFLTSTTVSGQGAVAGNSNTALIFALNTNSLSNNASGNGFNYHYSVTIDRVILSMQNVQSILTAAGGYCFYIGMYDSFMPIIIDPYPLICANLQASIVGSSLTNQQAFTINEPYYAVQSVTPTGFTGNWLVGVQYALNPMINGPDGYMGAGFSSGTFAVSRLPISGKGGTTLGGGVTIGYRGLFKDLLVSTMPGIKGDRVFWNFNGAQFNSTFMGSSGSGSWSSGVAAATGPWVLQI